ncbi:MAG: glucose-6-phosphate isomerase [Longimicrobiales bacterium]
MMERLELDYGNMLASRVGDHGIDAATLDGFAARFAAVHADIEKRRNTGQLGFFALPYERELVDRIRAFADGLGQAYENVVVLGIGGSALGTIALQHALLRPHWNELSNEQRDWFPRLYVLDNVDPTTIGPLLDRLDLDRSLFNVVSKSGTTAETMAQFLLVRDRLAHSLDDAYRRHFLFTTDPESGVLREIANDEGIPTLPIPPGVGGRFTVLSAVGLLPAALAGIEIEDLLAGAAAMDERCRTADLAANPAGLFATLQFLADSEKGAGIHVMMPYSDRLYGVADWFRQLWAESLGKRLDRNGAEVFRGPTPIKAIGATDQHSQVQLYVEGPFNKTITLLATAESAEDLHIPAAYPDVDALAYLGGQSFARLLDAERRGTTAALTRSGRMNMTITLAAVAAHDVGELLMMLEIATVYAGALYEVDPLDQPGVELGKQFTYALMGRPGFEAPAETDPEPRWICR